MSNRFFAIVTAVLASAASPALAQGVAPAPEQSNWLAIVTAMVLVIAVLTGSFLSARRNQQD